MNNGRFDEGTVGHRVDRRLEGLAEAMNDSAEGHEKRGAEKDETS